MGNRRSLLPIIVILFFAALGYWVSQEFARSPLFTRQTPAAASPIPNSLQENVLLIRADDLTSPQPRLVSVWITFLAFFDDEPFINAKSLFPTPNMPNVQERLGRLFSLKPDGSPSDEFLAELSRFNVQWTGYILYDQTAGVSLNTWLAENPAANSPGLPATGGQDPVVYAEEAAWVRSLCMVLGVPDQQRTAFNGWGSVLPGHMKTNFQFEKLALIWNNLDTPDKMPRCEILPPN